MKNKIPRIAFSKNSELTAIASNLFRCPKNKTDVDCANKTSEFKNKVLMELTKSMSRVGEDNVYNVEYKSEVKQARKPPVCMLIDNKIKLLRKKDPPFTNSKLGQLFPKHKLFRKSKEKSCIIVSSAGSLTGSELGSFIGEWKTSHQETFNQRSSMNFHSKFCRFSRHCDAVQSRTDRRVSTRRGEQDDDKNRKFSGKWSRYLF